ncbi:Tfp pilus assembly protein PilF [Acidipila rosea]|uniref:Tfp pilus assembly protein PilF n=2 Tax=Acidipila rosea TaxID=768535 RepID=A0A4R1L3I8_9BACT|nr:Tfp pilus assembly protein PilF [Acidipila rosea]
MKRMVLYFVVLLVSTGTYPAWAQAKAQQQVADHMARALEYLRQKQPAQAIPEFKAVVALDPSNLNARANLGVLLYFSGNYKDAIPQFEAALKLDPNLAKIRSLLGTSEERIGDLQGAAENLSGAFEKIDEPKVRIETGLSLIETYAAMGRLDKAGSIAGELRNMAPEDPAVLATVYQIYSQLADEALLSLSVVAPESAQMHMMMAHELVQQGNNAAAILQYQEALKINPNLPGLHYEYAEMLHNSPEPKLQAQAEGEYKLALEVNPFDEKALRGLGELAMEQGDLKTAEIQERRAVALEPNDSEAKTDLAKVLIALNQKQQAMALLESAIALDPTNYTAHYRLSTLYRQMGRTADARKQIEEFQHYKQLKDKLGKIFQQMRTAEDVKAQSEGGMK